MDVSNIILWVCAAVGAVILVAAFLVALLFVRNPFKRKSIVVGYRPEQYSSVNADSWTYFLIVERKNFFWKRKMEVRVEVPFSASIKAYHLHWDQLIASKQPVKL